MVEISSNQILVAVLVLAILVVTFLLFVSLYHHAVYWVKKKLQQPVQVPAMRSKKHVAEEEDAQGDNDEEQEVEVISVRKRGGR